MFFIMLGRKYFRCFYDNQKGEFMKKFSRETFERMLKNVYVKNRSVFSEAFSTLCYMKQNKRKKTIIKLKKGQFF